MPPAKLMSETFEMCEQMTFEGLASAISSPGSEDGRSPSGSQDVPTSAPYGLGVAHANRSAELAAGEEPPTNATCGPPGTASLRSAALQRCLESGLQEALGSNGSAMFALTWKGQAMPLGQPIFRLAASVRSINESGCGLAPWATPLASDGDGGVRRNDGKRGAALREQLKGWSGGPAQTESSGQLNPDLSRWLMRYPEIWSACAGTETPLFPRWQQCS